MTPQQLQHFRLQARHAGFSEQDINNYLSSGDTLEDRGKAWSEQQSTPDTSLTTPSVEQQPQKSTYEQGRGLLQKAAGFFGVEKFGEGLATVRDYGQPSANRAGDEAFTSLQHTNDIIQAIHKLPKGDPRRDHLLEYLKNSMNTSSYTPQEEVDPGTKLSNKEVIGSAANVALNVATPEAFKGGLGAQVGKNAALGGGYGLAGGLNDNKSGKDLATSTLSGALVAGTLPIAGAAAGKAKQFLTERLPENLMNRAIKPTLDDLKRNIKYGSDTFGKELLQEGVKGSPQKLLKIADTNLNKYENELQAVLKNSPATIKRDDLAKYLENLTAATTETPGLGSEVDKIKSVLAEFPEEVPLVRANQIKRNIYNEIRNVGYKLDASLNTKREAMKALASGIKQEIENKVGGTRIADINKKLSIYGRLEDRVVDILARSNKNNLFGLTDAILAGGGIASGSPLGFAAVLARHGLGSTRGMTETANLLSKGQKAGTGVVGKTLKAGARRAILNAP